MTTLDRSLSPTRRCRLFTSVGAAVFTVAALVTGAGPASADTVTHTIPVGAGPAGVAITPDGAHAYITNNDDTTVSVIDTATNTITATIPVNSEPAGVAITPDGVHAYITNAGVDGEDSVSVIDTA